jgi:hydrogenase expression/formation protein HypE
MVRIRNDLIRIGHGSGGRLSRELIDHVFVKHFSNPLLDQLSDAAYLKSTNEALAFTTDSYVIDPIFFPGGDIGQLAVSGTVNDLCVSGAKPLYMSTGFIIEEGFSISELEKIAGSMAKEAKIAGIQIVTGDTKVVKKGQCDKIFINTSGIGVISDDRLHLKDIGTITPGDKIIVTGTLGDHAIAILCARENLKLDEKIVSDATPLNSLTEKILENPEDIKFMRDITRGGLATILVETCEKKPFGIQVNEKAVPVHQSVQSVCDLYGFDPMYLANEGKIMIVVKSGEEESVLSRIRLDNKGQEAAIIGEITETNRGKAVMISSIGGKRMIDMLSGEMLPRIC